MKAFIFLFCRFILRDLKLNLFRTLLTISGIALGVAVALSIYLANQSVLSAFKESINLISGKANLCIVAKTEPYFNENCLNKITWLWEEDCQFTPVIEELIVSEGEKIEPIKVIGIDFLASSDFQQENSLSLAKFKEDNSANLFNSKHVCVGPNLALAYDLKPGSILEVLVNEHSDKLFVTSILDQNSFGRAFAGKLICMDIGVCQDFLNLKHKISRIDIICPESKVEEIKRRIEQCVPKNLAIERPGRRGLLVEKMIRSFQFNLTALSLIALLVAMFLIYNSMSISVIRRRTELGTLRTIGLSKKFIFLIFAFESIFLGLIGSLLGSFLGYLFSKSSCKAVSTTINALYTDGEVSNITFDPSIIFSALIMGIVFTLLASFFPVLEASLVSAAEASRRASYETRMPTRSKILAKIAICFVVLAVIAAYAPPYNNFPVFGYLSAFASVFSFAFFCPFFLNHILYLFQNAFVKPLGIEFKLAILSLRSALGRTSVAVAALIVGISMMVSLSVMIGSFRHTVICWVEQTLTAHLFLESETRKVSNRTGYLSSEIVSKIKKISGIEAVDAFVEYPIEFEGARTNLGAGELDVMLKYGNLNFVDGEPSKSVLARVIEKKAAIISESLALKHNKHKGDLLTFSGEKGTFSVRIEGIYYDYSSDSGYIIIPRNLFSKYFSDNFSTTLAIFLAPEFRENPEVIKESIARALGKEVRLNIRSNKELKQEVLRVFDNTFAITYVLHAISILVAILGVTNTLFAIVMDSKRDLSIMKLIGVGSGQIHKLVIWQAFFLGLLGMIGGLALGFILSFLLIHVINKQSFGWTIQFSMPYKFLFESSFLILFCAILSGLFPSRFAVKNATPQTVRQE